jgi:hypothetical protein
MADERFDLSTLNLENSFTLNKPNQRDLGQFDQKLGQLLAGPLDHLLISGGDTRLRIDSETGLNNYGCRASPRSEAISFASSTASSISDYGYAKAETARAGLLVVRNRPELVENINAQTEQQRSELASLFGIQGMGTEIIFASSGTDAQALALCVARAVLRSPVHSIVVGSDETGSGTGYVTEGRHFSGITSRGVKVERGATILGLEGASKVSIPLRSEVGRLYSNAEVDAEVFRNVRESVHSGKSVLLYVMDHSKLGSQCPSDSCIREILGNWPDSVQVAVDACQLRLSGARIRAYLNDGHIVIITGSKFFAGPPFSGALLVPRSVSETMGAVEQVPVGLRAYSNAIDWPLRWKGIRSQLPKDANIGQFLRWAVSLTEMRNYFLVPALHRRLALREFAGSVFAAMEASKNVRLLPCVKETTDHSADDEMTVRTIFPFLVYRNGASMSLSETQIIYRALNLNISGTFVDRREKEISQKLCHIGQPVGVRVEGGNLAGALRISCDARLVSQNWFDWGKQTMPKELDLQLNAVVNKLNLIVNHFDAVVSRVSPRPAESQY